MSEKKLKEIDIDKKFVCADFSSIEFKNEIHNITKRKQKRILFIFFAFFVSVTSLIFIIKNFKDNIIFFYSPSEITIDIKSSGKIIKVGGLVKKGSIKNNTGESKPYIGENMILK